MANSIEQLIVNRRTINDFTQDVPDRNIIKNAIELARWVPNHHMTQPWHFYFPNREMVEQIVDLNSTLVEHKKGKTAAANKRRRWQNIPGWLVVTCELSGDELRQQEDYAACCCSVYALSLILWQYRIGVKWTTGDVIRQQQFYDICWLDHLSQTVVGLIWYGYPDTVPDPQHRRRSDEIITEF